MALFHHIHFATTRGGGWAGRQQHSHPKPFNSLDVKRKVRTEELDNLFVGGGLDVPLMALEGAEAEADDDSEADDSKTVSPSAMSSADKFKAMEGAAKILEVQMLMQTSDNALAHALQDGAASEAAIRMAPEDTPAAAGSTAQAFPEPTLSKQRLLDGSANWLPVADAESTSPSDLAWRNQIPVACAAPAGAADMPITTAAPVRPAGCSCPPGRKPYHTILTAQASTYQRWQTLIFYHHFKKQQRLHPCTEMVGFTRLLASDNARSDDLMNLMPTVTVPQLGFDKTRGFQVRLCPRDVPACADL